MSFYSFSEPSYLELQNEVIKDIFLEIIDSTYIDSRLYILFSENGKSVYDNEGKWNGK